MNMITKPFPHPVYHVHPVEFPSVRRGSMEEVVRLPKIPTDDLAFWQLHSPNPR